MEGVFLDESRLALEKARGIWPDRVVTDYLDRWVAEKPGDTALIAFRDEDATTTQLTWRELGERVAAIARGLSARGVARGDVVSFQLPNWWEFVAVHLACVRVRYAAPGTASRERGRESVSRRRGRRQAILARADRCRRPDAADAGREDSEVRSSRDREGLSRSAAGGDGQ